MSNQKGSSATRQRIAVAGLLVFAGTVLVSGFLKLRYPFAAAHAVAWTGLDRASRLVAVDVLSLAEVVCGALLLCGMRFRILLVASAALAAGLIAGRGVSMVHDPLAGCGCFGTLEVPGGAVLASLGIGLASALTVRRERHFGSMRPWRAAGVAAVVAAAALQPLLRPGVPALPAAEALVAALNMETLGDRDLVLIGSSSCADCRDAVRRIAASRRRDDGACALRLHFVERASDVAPKPAWLTRAWIVPHRVPDRLWWRLIDDAPPVFLRRTEKGIVAARTWTVTRGGGA